MHKRMQRVDTEASSARARELTRSKSFQLLGLAGTCNAKPEPENLKADLKLQTKCPSVEALVLRHSAYTNTLIY